MTPHTPKNSFLFERIFVCLAILSPMVMVIVAGMRPVGTRGALIVTGHEYLAAMLGIALISRMVYLRAIARRSASFRDGVELAGLMGTEQPREHRYG